MRKSLKILYILPYPPSLIRVRPYSLIRELIKVGHTVDVIYLVDSREEMGVNRIDMEGVRVERFELKKWESYVNFFRYGYQFPFHVAYDFSPKFLNLVNRAIERGEYDIVHIEFWRALPALSVVEGLPVVFDAVDATWIAFKNLYRNLSLLSPLRWLYYIESKRLLKFAKRNLYKVSSTVVSSEREAAAFSMHGLGEPEVITNGVDTEQFSLGPPYEERENALIFVGKMSYLPNQRAVLTLVDKILPEMRSNSRLKTYIVGAKPPRFIQRMDMGDGIVVTGTVPSVVPYLHRAKIFVAPLREAVGIQNKVLEAMATGTPVVTTREVVDGLLPPVREGVIVAKDERDFASKIKELLHNSSYWNEVSAKSRKLVEDYHSWKKAREKLEEIYHSVLKTG